MKDDLEDAEQLNFDFEAYPICTGDKDSLINLLTQVCLVILRFSRRTVIVPAYIFP